MPIGRTAPVVLAAALAAALVVAPGCARRSAVLELQAVVLYDKPTIESIEHRLDDDRPNGGEVTVTVTLVGDPGLAAAFDISPGIARQVAMREASAGRYTGTFTFPYDTLGGPFTVLGRLRHPEAGEVVVQDPRPIFIPLPELER